MQADGDTNRDDGTQVSGGSAAGTRAISAARATGCRALLPAARKNCQAEDCIGII